LERSSPGAVPRFHPTAAGVRGAGSQIKEEKLGALALPMAALGLGWIGLIILIIIIIILIRVIL